MVPLSHLQVTQRLEIPEACNVSSNGRNLRNVTLPCVVCMFLAPWRSKTRKNRNQPLEEQIQLKCFKGSTGNLWMREVGFGSSQFDRCLIGWYFRGLPIVMDHFSIQFCTEEPRCSWVHRWTSRRLHASRASSLWRAWGPWKGRVFLWRQMPSSVSPLRRCTSRTATTKMKKMKKMKLLRMVVPSMFVAISLSRAILAFTIVAQTMVDPWLEVFVRGSFWVVDGESVLVF